MERAEDYVVDAEAAVRTYADMVYRLACLNTNNKETAEDVFQTVFLKLVSHQREASSSVRRLVQGGVGVSESSERNGPSLSSLKRIAPIRVSS